ncbi:MAG: hypothetical protein JW995_05400 [Melioribacteraceae bacterium]|nr:hypothetical protein [Melioribacteraceae bacterium]
MSTEEINKMTDSYFDGELDKSKEPVLFTHLSLDNESREYFKSLNKIKNTITETIQEFPAELEERILYSAADTEKKWFHFNISNNLPSILSYAAALILLITSIFLYSQTVDYKDAIETYKQTINIKTRQVNKQNQLIDVLFNTLPPAEVKGNTNEVVVNSNS